MLAAMLKGSAIAFGLYCRRRNDCEHRNDEFTQILARKRGNTRRRKNLPRLRASSVIASKSAWPTQSRHKVYISPTRNVRGSLSSHTKHHDAPTRDAQRQPRTQIGIQGVLQKHDWEFYALLLCLVSYDRGQGPSRTMPSPTSTLAPARGMYFWQEPARLCSSSLVRERRYGHKYLLTQRVPIGQLRRASF